MVFSRNSGHAVEVPWPQHSAFWSPLPGVSQTAAVSAPFVSQKFGDFLAKPGARLMCHRSSPWKTRRVSEVLWAASPEGDTAPERSPRAGAAGAAPGQQPRRSRTALPLWAVLGCVMGCLGSGWPLPAAESALYGAPQAADGVSFPLLWFPHANLRGKKTTKRAFCKSHITWDAACLHIVLLWLAVHLPVPPGHSVFLPSHLGLGAGGVHPPCSHWHHPAPETIRQVRKCCKCNCGATTWTTSTRICL